MHSMSGTQGYPESMKKPVEKRTLKLTSDEDSDEDDESEIKPTPMQQALISMHPERIPSEDKLALRKTKQKESTIYLNRMPISKSQPAIRNKQKAKVRRALRKEGCPKGPSVRAGVLISRYKSDNAMTGGSRALKSKAKVQNLIDPDTVSLIKLEKVKPKQSDILMHFNRRCLFCRKAVKTYAATDKRSFFFSDRKNGKIYIAHRRCAEKASQKYLESETYILSAIKLQSFQLNMSDEAIHNDFEEARKSPSKCVISVSMHHPINHSKKFYSLENLTLVPLVKLKAKNSTFISENRSSFHLLMAYIKLRIQFKNFKVPPVEVALDLFQLAHEAEFGQNILCDVESKGMTITLEFKLHQFTQTDSIDSEHSVSSGDEGVAPTEYKVMKRVQFLLQDTRFMIEFQDKPEKGLIQATAEQKRKEVDEFPHRTISSPAVFDQKKKNGGGPLRLQAVVDSESSSSDSDERESQEQEKQANFITEDAEEQEDADEVEAEVPPPPLKQKHSPPQQQEKLTGLQKYYSAQEVASPFQSLMASSPPKQAPQIKVVEEEKKTIPISRESKDLEDGLKSSTRFPAPSKGVDLQRFVTLAGVQNIMPHGPPRYLSGYSMQQPVMEGTPGYQYATQYPGHLTNLPVFVSSQRPMPPPPGFGAGRQGVMEKSHGMVVSRQNFGTKLGEEAKKNKKKSKKKTAEKSVTVVYHGEKLVLSMGVDAKENQITPYESSLFENPSKIEIVDGKILELAKSFSGSKALQAYLTRGSNEITKMIIEESSAGIADLMTNKYGNYYSQKMLQSCSATQRISILKQLLPDFFRISADWSGTHSMQALIALLNLDQEFEYVKQAVEANVMELAIHSQATHVLQKIIACFPQENIGYIYKTLVQNLNDLCCNSNGLCVVSFSLGQVKKLITKTKQEDKVHCLGSSLVKITKEIVQDPFGNYAIQHCLEAWPYEPIGKKYCSEIMKILMAHWAQYASSKYSSNVMEKCLEVYPVEASNAIWSKISQDEDQMFQLLGNTFAGYVITKLLEKMPRGASFGKLINLMKALIKRISDKTNRARWETTLEEVVPPGTQYATVQPQALTTSQPPLQLPVQTKPLQVKLNLGAQSFAGPQS